MWLLLWWLPQFSNSGAPDDVTGTLLRTLRRLRARNVATWN